MDIGELEVGKIYGFERDTTVLPPLPAAIVGQYSQNRMAFRNPEVARIKVTEVKSAVPNSTARVQLLNSEFRPIGTALLMRNSGLKNYFEEPNVPSASDIAGRRRSRHRKTRRRKTRRHSK